MTVMSKFACNMEAMNQQERQRYTALTKRLFAKAERSEIENGYIFIFAVETDLADIAHWATLERKCCPFFDFHILAPSANRPISLSLTGEAGVKDVIRAELGAT